tara:strand:+ start:2164 stop:2637 length:474 start_codon:yes stop_codon:yes gene_type:complete
MSNIAIKGAATGSGTFTLESPATNTNRTLTLPDEAGTVLTSVSDIAAAKLTGALPAIDGAGLTNLPTSGVGVGQTWQTLTSSRTSGTTYYNTTGRTIMISGSVSNGGSAVLNMVVNGVQAQYTQASNANPGCNTLVPPGASYSATFSGSMNYWAELR